MFKQTAIIIAAVIAASATFAQELQPTSSATTAGTASRAQVRADLDTARAAGAWPVHEYSDAQQAEGGSRKANRRPRKEYPNVMGMSITEWLASQQ
jgi:hypothetical protein